MDKVFCAIDPGETTGYVIAKGLSSPLAVGQTKDFKELRLLLDKYRPDVIIYEVFRLFKHKAVSQSGSEMPAPLVTGRLLEWCETQDYAIDIVKQPPSIMKAVSKELLRATGWYDRTTSTIHARDAVTHLIAYFMSKPEYNKEVMKYVHSLER